MQDLRQIRNTIHEVLGLIAEHPKSAIPIAAIGALLFLGTSIKTLIDGYSWAYNTWGGWGALFIVAVVLLSLMVAIYIVRQAVKPRPTIADIKSPLLSRCPTISWEYDGSDSDTAEYSVQIRSLNDRKTKEFLVPSRMKYKELRTGPFGRISIKVAAVHGNKAKRYSTPITAEFYEDSLQRIEHTGILRVGVHADPGEDIFCFHDGKDWKGFDIELSQMIASHLGTQLDLIGSANKIDVQPCFYKWPDVISSPNHFEVDFAIASISISGQRKRAENILFSSPYATSGLGVVFQEQNHQFENEHQVHLTKLIGSSVIVHKDTTASRLFDTNDMKQKFNVIEADTNAEVTALLMNGSGDFVVYDHLRSFSFLAPGIAVRKLEYGSEAPEDKYGITFALVNTPLQKLVDQYLTNNYDHIQNKLNQLIQRKQCSVTQGLTVESAISSSTEP